VPRPRVAVSWSSGKDSAWTLAELLRDDAVEVAGLLTTVEADGGRVVAHGLPPGLLDRQVAATGLPVWKVPLPSPCPNAAYEAAMADAARALRAAGVERLACGDLWLEDVRAYREALLDRVGLPGSFPLWGRDTAALARAMLAGGLEAVVTVVDTDRLDPSFCGRPFDAALLADLPPGVDPCGERGELHTVVTRAPGFARPVPVQVERVTREGAFARAELAAA